MKPTIGRIVQYRTEDDKDVPAIITFVGTNYITLTLFHQTSTETGIMSRIMAAGPRDAAPRQWWWPERV